MRHGSGQALRAVQAGPFHVSRVVHRAGFRLGAHEHRHACLHFVVSGVYSERVRGGSLEVGASGMVIKPPHTRHSNVFAHRSETLRIDVPGDADSLDRILPNTTRELLDERSRILCRQILRELQEDDDCGAISLHGLCLQLFAAVARRGGIGQRTGSSPEPPAVRRAAEFLHEHYVGSVCFGSLARILGVSRSHLAVSFRRHRGCTLGDFVRRLRVDHVLRGLAQGGRSLSSLSADAGFADQSHCTRVVRSMTGRTPGEWQQELANTRSSPARSF